jgi:hypothetical protein
MTEWSPPQHVAPDGSEHLAALLVISTPDGFTSQWEGDQPSAAVSSEVSEFARQMSVEDFIHAPRIGLPELEHVDELGTLGDVWRHGESRPDQPTEIPREDEFGRVVYLRLNVRACTPEQSAAWGRERVIDFEFGPMGAPPEYPRVSINDLFRHAAETA